MTFAFICEIIAFCIFALAAGALLGVALAPFVVFGQWVEYKTACEKRGKKATLEGFQGYQEWKKRQSEDRTDREAKSWD